MANEAPADDAPRERRSHARAEGTPTEVENAIFDARGAIGERRLSARAKLRRTVFIGLASALALAIVLGVPGAMLTRLRAVATSSRTTPAPPPPPTFVASAPQASRVPSEATTVGDIQIQPINGQRETGYACWIAPRATGPNGTAGPVHLSLTTDAGQHWQALALPAANATFCSPEPDSADPMAALVTVIPPSSVAQPCPLPWLFLTRDRGQHWQQVPWPPGAAPVCGLQLALTAHHVYAWNASPLLPAAGTSSRLIATPDAGQHWVAIGGGLARDSNPELLAARSNGWLLAQTEIPNAAPPGQTELWQSGDDGASWQRLGPIPGTAPTVLVSLDPATLATTRWGRLYSVGQRDATPDATPAAGAGQILATTTDGIHWQTIAPPPDTAVRPGPSIPRSLVGVGLGAGETLLLTRELDPTSNLLFVAARQLWRWDPAHGHWLLAPYSLRENVLVDGLTWQDGQPTLWLTVVRAGVPPSVTLNLDAVGM